MSGASIRSSRRELLPLRTVSLLKAVVFLAPFVVVLLLLPSRIRLVGIEFSYVRVRQLRHPDAETDISSLVDPPVLIQLLGRTGLGPLIDTCDSRRRWGSHRLTILRPEELL